MPLPFQIHSKQPSISRNARIDPISIDPISLVLNKKKNVPQNDHQLYSDCVATTHKLCCVHSCWLAFFLKQPVQLDDFEMVGQLPGTYYYEWEGVPFS